MKHFYCCILFYSLVLSLNAQDVAPHPSDSSQLNKKRLTGVVITESTVYLASVIGLSQLWYKDFPKSKFHFFNDNGQWMQMDKVGHAFSAYYIGRVGMDIFDWTGLDHKKSIWIGGNIATVALTTIEIYDGFSVNWGASLGDMFANLAGTALLISQELAWEDQVIVMKYSFRPSKFAQHREELLGAKFSEQFLKDYNGQTYWLSANVVSMFRKESKIPKWVNVAVGYSANGMVGGEANLLNDSLGFYPYRQYFISLDIDFTRIETKSKFLRTFFRAINVFKVPFPAMYLSKKGIKLKPFYF
ncbi:MAG: DUF2279 domain-containing protein [Bacteroidetes bacterium]|nr:DUF2279 domain-containing protein [Bacteroidota bacterium]